MHAPGVEVRPLRQMTGGASFNEVFFTDVRVPDSHRLGDVNGGWTVALTTLMNERAAIGGGGGGSDFRPANRLGRDGPGHRPGRRPAGPPEAGHDDHQRVGWPSTPTCGRWPRSPSASCPGPEMSLAKLSLTDNMLRTDELVSTVLGPAWWPTPVSGARTPGPSSCSASRACGWPGAPTRCCATSWASACSACPRSPGRPERRREGRHPGPPGPAEGHPLDEGPAAAGAPKRGRGRPGPSCGSVTDSPCSDRSRSGKLSAISRISRSRVTLATMEAAAMDTQMASPSTTVRTGGAARCAGVDSGPGLRAAASPSRRSGLDRVADVVEGTVEAAPPGARPAGPRGPGGRPGAGQRSSPADRTRSGPTCPTAQSTPHPVTKG